MILNETGSRAAGATTVSFRQQCRYPNGPVYAHRTPLSRILPLSAITLNDIDQVGGKAAHLGAMLRAGFPVPPGFVITVDAFVDHFGETTDPLVKPRPPQLKAELMAEVVQGLLDHLGHDTELVVRSSSTEEDGQFASFAGQHSTYYFVNPTRIDQAIVDCWMSLWSASAVAYRRAGWGDIASGEPLRMAVVVQRLVQAVRSGVTFSKHPVEASDDVVIEASWGLGAALVDGRVSPDHIRLDDQGRLQSYTVSDKRFQVLPKQATARLQEVAGSQRHQPVLTEAEAEALANVALQLETLFEGPQDVEWAYDADTLYLLQSRAITSRPEVCDTQRQWVIFKPLLENFTEPLTPLSEDLVAAALPRASATYRGRVYLPIDLVRMLAPFELSDAEAAQLMLLRAQPALRLSPWRALRAGALFALGFLGDGANWLRAARVQRSDLDRYPEVLRRLTRSSRLDLPAFTRRVVWARHSFVPADRQMFALNISSGRYFLYIGLLRALVSRWAPEFPEAQLQALYHGDRRMASLDMLEALGALAALVRRDLQLLASLKDGPDALPTGHPFTVAFEAFLATYGHRGPREMEFAAPRWRERPGDLLSLVLAQAEAPSRERQDAHGPFLAARDQLHQQLRPWQRSVVRRLTAAINRFIELRENTRHYHIMGFDAVRTRILSVEDELLV